MIIAGEASGDLHGSSLALALRQLDPELELFGIGGDRMQRAGVELLYHASQMAYMGFTEVLRHLPALRRAFSRTLHEATVRRPDLVVLIDYPGFNLRFAEAAKRRGLKVLYYIVPQLWAWRRGRLTKMARSVHAAAVIFPFEEPLFASAGIPTTFVGHPLLDVLRVTDDRQAFFARHGLDPQRPLLALLPGSRIQEVRSLLPVMLQAVDKLRPTLPGLQAVVAKADTVADDVYAPLLAAHPHIATARGDTHACLKHADAAAVASGTATLEAACLGTPFVLGYRVSWLSYQLMRRLIRIPYIGLVNVVAGKQVVRELVQGDFAPEPLAAELNMLLQDQTRREAMRRELRLVAEKLGSPGAARRTAELALRLMETHSEE
ncbi:MAG: lipid-A-disaccharide synthase [Calditrichaeota bacterium]|nr:lipid-A-disaccharide synthase [Calditrichota bacterium]